MKHSFLVLVALGLLTSCSTVKETVDPVAVPLEQSVKDWLHEQNGQVLTFRNAAGSAQTVLVRRRNEFTTGAAVKGSPARVKVESVTLTYSRLPVRLDSVSVVADYKTQLLFYETGLLAGTSSGSYHRLATVYTYSDHSQDSAGPAWVLVNNYPLGGRIYASMVRLTQVASGQGLATPAAFEELYYSRTDGLVGFKTLDGQLWTRP